MRIIFLKNRKGQVAIFVALIFQLLFLFFAMVVNVGLLVHHKINLQNSVDLAAYYGAMKQAEMLNAMAHVNYQIRQSWKLLAWRYRVLGSGGSEEEGANPYNRFTGQLNPGLDREGPHPTIANAYKTPIFCATYSPMDFKDSSGRLVSDEKENLCKGILSGGSRITLFTAPSVAAGFIGIATVIQQATQQAIEIATKKCEWSGYFNFATLATLSTAYNFDQYARRILLARMGRRLSESADDFFDIDGESVKQGVQNTLLNNLSEPNRESVKFEMLNGLAQGPCHGSPSSEYDPPAWLSEITVFPGFNYQDNICNDKAIEPVAKLLDPQFIPNRLDNIQREDVKELAKFLGRPDRPYQFTMGYEKNPWCMAYVGIKAKSKPKIPFSPADFELSARAFAKPFGGRFGPWYFKNWSSGSFKSSGSNESMDEKSDPLAPPRIEDPSQIGNPAVEQRAANYSRFVGDRLGLMSMQPLGQYIKALHDPKTKVLLNDWRHLIFDRNSQKIMYVRDNQERDLLAWGWFDNQRPPIRDIEISAVAPDQFDITYYSIDANFYDNYFKRIRDGKLLQKIGYELPLRSDIGSRFNSTPELERFSVKDQIDYVKNKIPQLLLDHESKLTHIVRDPFHLLTSWTAKDLLDFSSIPTDKYFGGCLKPVAEITQEKRKPYPGDCILGGRTGYSVKLISSDYLRANDLEMGGPTSRGPILNAPDQSW